MADRTGEIWVERRKRYEEMVKIPVPDAWEALDLSLRRSLRTFHELYGEKANLQPWIREPRDGELQITLTSNDSERIYGFRQVALDEPGNRVVVKAAGSFVMSLTFAFGGFLNADGGAITVDEASRIILEPFLFAQLAAMRGDTE